MVQKRPENVPMPPLDIPLIIHLFPTCQPKIDKPYTVNPPKMMNGNKIFKKRQTFNAFSNNYNDAPVKEDYFAPKILPLSKPYSVT